MKGKAENNIDGFFRKAFENYEADSSEFIWDKLDKKLSSSETPFLKHAPQARKIRLINFAKPAIKIAATFLIIATAAAATYFTVYTVKKYDLINKIFSKKPQPAPSEKQEPLVITDTSATEIKQEGEQLNVYDDSVASILHHESLMDKPLKEEQKPSGEISVNKPKENKKQTIPASGMTGREQTPVPIQGKEAQDMQEQQSGDKMPDNALSKDDQKKTETGREQAVTEPALENRQPVIPPQAEPPETSAKLNIPNVFTPNGDGINDRFVIENLDKYTANRLVISDRSGKTVFETINYKNDWDGANLPQGVYFYILTVREESGRAQAYQGMITIMR